MMDKLKPVQLFVFHNPYSDEELEALYRKSPGQFDYRFFKYFRYLEHNDKFQEWIANMRKKVNIPTGGYDWQDNKILTGFKDINEIDRKYMQFISDEDLDSLNNMLRPGQKNKLSGLDWSDLVTSNAIRLPLGRPANISISPDKYSKTNRKFTIYFDNHFTLTELQKYLKLHWWFLKKFIEDPDLPNDLPIIKVKERDFYVLYLRDIEKLKFTQIADKLDEKFPLKKDHNSEDYAKNLYHRAKAKADLAFNERNQEKKVSVE
jgi:hypothetical protein